MHGWRVDWSWASGVCRVLGRGCCNITYRLVTSRSIVQACVSYMNRLLIMLLVVLNMAVAVLTMFTMTLMAAVVVLGCKINVRDTGLLDAPVGEDTPESINGNDDEEDEASAGNQSRRSDVGLPEAQVGVAEDKKCNRETESQNTSDHGEPVENVPLCLADEVQAAHVDDDEDEEGAPVVVVCHVPCVSCDIGCPFAIWDFDTDTGVDCSTKIVNDGVESVRKGYCVS